MKKKLSLSVIAGLLAFSSSTLAQPYVYQPTNVAGAGLSYVVPDKLVWYSLNGYVTNGPVKPGVNGSGVPFQVWNNDIWEAYGGVLGDSAFLLQTMTFADDGIGYTDLTDPHGHQRYTVTIAPADGSPPRTVDAFYDDYGHAFTNQVSSRQDGNPGRVAGDRRYGATNIMTGGEASLQEWPAYFDSDNRWDHPLYAQLGIDNAVRFSAVQTFGVNPGNWSVKQLCKAFDMAFSPDPAALAQSATSQQMGRFGGDMTALSDGNFLVGVEDRSQIYFPVGNASLAAIVRPDGTYVKATWPVAPKNFWTGVMAFKGGFCIRVGSWNQSDWDAGWSNGVLVPPTGTDALLFFYDNAGNCYATNSMNASSGLSWSQSNSRGDGAALAADIRSHYVYYTDKIPGNSGDGVVGIWDGRTGAFVTNATWTTTDPSKHSLDAFGIGVDALDRFCVAVDMRPDTAAFPAYQDAARVGKFDGTNITWLTPMFYPFVNHESDTANIKGIQTSVNPYVMMTTKAICIAARCWANSTNNPAAGPDTANPSCLLNSTCTIGDSGQDRTVVYTIISHPAPVAAPRPSLTVTKSGGNAVLSWPYDLVTYGFWTLQSSPSISPGSWSPQANVVVVGSTAYSTNAIAGKNYYRLAR